MRLFLIDPEKPLSRDEREGLAAMRDELRGMERMHYASGGRSLEDMIDNLRYEIACLDAREDL